MQEIGATISVKGASSSQVKSLQEAVASIGQKLGLNDASTIGGTMNNNAIVLTNDKQMVKLMNALDLPGKSF
ncbi:hypothetical protein [Chitinophaga caseinilytica]|jgi:hypothetical protein|uniref:hypothetical protein n=1 Tax=Chitinophaga caseinilytica TaxID=2267521 RepID=UPI003C30C50A